MTTPTKPGQRCRIVGSWSLDDQGVDHRNNIRTDNRWLNLRAANQHNNSGNIAAPSHNTSGVKGVSRNAKSEKWHAQIKIFGKQTYLGRSSNIWVAALLYNFAAENHFGAFAKLNSIPDLGRRTARQH